MSLKNEPNQEVTVELISDIVFPSAGVAANHLAITLSAVAAAGNVDPTPVLLSPRVGLLEVLPSQFDQFDQEPLRPVSPCLLACSSLLLR